MWCPHQELEAAERLRVSRAGLEVTSEKLEAELEETKQRLRAALASSVPEGAEAKASKATVVTRSALHSQLDTSGHSLHITRLFHKG